MAGRLSPADVDATPLQHVTATPSCQSLLLEAPSWGRRGRGRGVRPTGDTTSACLPGLPWYLPAVSVCPVVSARGCLSARGGCLSARSGCQTQRKPDSPLLRAATRHETPGAGWDEFHTTEFRDRIVPRHGPKLLSTSRVGPQALALAPCGAPRRIRATWVGSLRQRGGQAPSLKAVEVLARRIRLGAV
jgi:hypothetical protein